MMVFPGKWVSHIPGFKGCDLNLPLSVISGNGKCVLGGPFAERVLARGVPHWFPFGKNPLVWEGTRNLGFSKLYSHGGFFHQIGPPKPYLGEWTFGAPLGALPYGHTNFGGPKYLGGI